MNGVYNAGFLDGPNSWLYAGAFAADETVRGAPGRIVGTANGGDLVSNAGPAVVAGQVCEVFAHHAATGGPSNLYLRVGAAQTIVPLVHAGDGTPRRGLPASMRFSYGRVAAPGTGTAVVRCIGSGTVMLMKPFIDPAPPARRQAWQAGPHANPDLDLGAWPTSLPLPDPSSYDARPIPTRKAFAGDSGVPIFRRVSRMQRQNLKLLYDFSLEQRDVFDQFVREEAGPFWFNRPDTQQLCRAYWTAEGDPSDQGGGVVRRTSIELLTEVA